MKRLLALILALAMCMTLVACGGKDNYEEIAKGVVKATFEGDANKVASYLHDSMNLQKSDLDFMKDFTSDIELKDIEVVASRKYDSDRRDRAIRMNEDVFGKIPEIGDIYDVTVKVDIEVNGRTPQTEEIHVSVAEIEEEWYVIVSDD